MGGNKKVSNRTKNNARPSSSGRCAAMLNVTQIGGFSGIKETNALSTFSLSSFDEFDTVIDENFQLVIKKISKKDSTTKLKGLHELAELVKSAETSTVKAILPIWQRVFCILSTDFDNKVREATHNVHYEVVTKVRRDIAPYLKQIIGPWFTAQYDNYPPAASAAIRSFKDTFPEPKFDEVIIFCQNEILSYVFENLSSQIAQSNDRSATSKDLEAKYERVLVSCLQGYSLYLQKVPEAKINDSIEMNTRIVLNDSFWKLAESQISLVRLAWFQLLSVILQKAVFLVNGKESAVLSNTLKHLEDDDPVVSPRVWECILLATSKIQNWWQYNDPETTLIPKLLKVVKLGGQGNASIIYPNLLPLISNLPPFENEYPVFYMKFFESMRTGLELKSVLSSRSETKAIVAAYIECIKFLIRNKSSNMDLCKLLIREQLIPIINWCIANNNFNYKKHFVEISKFVQNFYLSNTSSELIGFIYESIEIMFNQQLQSNLSSSDQLNSITEKQIAFLQSLRKFHRLTNECNVAFTTEDGQKNTSKKTDEPSKQDESFSGFVEKLALHLCQNYIDVITSTQSNDIVNKLYSILMEYNKKPFLESVIVKSSSDQNGKLIDFYSTILKKWLCCESTYCKSVIELIFLVLRYVEDQEKEIILSELAEINQSNCLMWSISMALSHPYIEMPVIQKWLRGNKPGMFFIDVAEKIITNDCSPELESLFNLALTENRNGDLIIADEILEKIIETISSALSKEEDIDVINFDSCCRLGAHLCSIIYTQNLLLNYGDSLLLTLFHISCKYDTDDNLSVETVWEVKSAWSDALLILLENLTEQKVTVLLEKIAAVIETFFSLTFISNKEQVEHLANITSLCIRVIRKSEQKTLSKIILERPWLKRRAIVDLCKMAEYLKGNLNFAVERPQVDSLNEKDIVQYFAWSFIKLYTWYSTTEEHEDDIIYDDAVDQEAKKTIRNISDLLSEDLLIRLSDYAMVESFLMNFKNVKFYEEISYYATCSKKIVNKIISYFDEALFTVIEGKLDKISSDNDTFWHNTFSSCFMNYVKNNRNPAEEVTHKTNSRNLFLEDVDQRDNFTEMNAVNEIQTKVIEEMEKFKNENFHFFCYKNANTIPWEEVERLIGIIRTNSKIIRHCSLTQKYWDLLVMSLVTWVSNCLAQKNLLGEIQFQSVLISLSELYVNISIRLSEQKKDSSDLNFVNEWEDIILESIHADISAIWIHLSEQFSSKQTFPLLNVPFIQYFGPVIEQLKWELLFKTSGDTPEWRTFLKNSCSLLTNSQTILQLWGYRMLKIMLPGIIKVDSEAVKNSAQDGKEYLVFEQLKNNLTDIQTIVDTMLMDFRMVDNICKVEPSYDSFTYIFAYLLLWDVMLCLCEKAPVELRYQYTDCLKNGNLITYLLQTTFKLISPEVFQLQEQSAKSNERFITNPLDSRCYNKFCNSETVEHLVCYLYKTCLIQLPALVRQWWTDLDTKASQLVERITTTYVSPQLILGELNDVVEHQNTFKNMKVRVLPGIREIIAVYQVDETQMELTIILPANYPLGNPTVECDRQISGSNQKQWLLQFNKCVLYQNGKILDGLSLWNNNLDKKFEGVEECFICYSVLHFGTYQLPRLSCQTCKKKFHSSCLYKWFSTSNKSSCPICRNLF